VSGCGLLEDGGGGGNTRRTARAGLRLHERVVHVLWDSRTSTAHVQASSIS
jgi:hypothetical protein